ncbi:MAG: hypothetical protein ACI8WB_004952 [Phenylobacterium sp.]|jgi:hypothetical protein
MFKVGGVALLRYLLCDFHFLVVASDGLSVL